MTTPLKNLIPLALKKINYQKKTQVLTVAGLYAAFIEKIINKKAAQNSCVLDIKEQVLWIQTTSSVWSCEVSFYIDQILSKINRELGEERLKQVQFVTKGLL